MSRLKRLIHEVHRRSLWQVTGIYLAGSWLALQVVQLLTQNVGLPDWVPAFSVALLVLGLPIVVATAFVQEGRSAGSAGDRRRTGSPAADDPTTAGPPGGEAAPATSGSIDPPHALGPHARLLTWRNAILGGAGAFILLGIAVAGYMGSRVMGIGPAATLVAQGVLEEAEPVLVADFVSPPADSLLARAATEAFRVDLSQSRAVRVVSASQVAGALRRMGRAPDARVADETAREVALREEIRAVVAGEIHPAGRGYVLSARLVSPADGEVLASAREEASDSTAILAAIDGLSKRLRERVGESLRSIRADPPLARVTTSSLDALRRYSQAVRAIDLGGDELKAIALLEEAIELDSTFAMAHRKLGVVLSNLGIERDRVVTSLTRAYEHRDRLTERERYLAAASYHMQVLGEDRRAITAYETLLDRYPDEPVALNNLALLYGRNRDPERAVELYRRAVEADSSSSLVLFNLVEATARLGRFEEADDLLERGRRLFPEHRTLEVEAAGLAAAKGAYDEAEATLARVRRAHPADPEVQGRTAWALGRLAALRGRLSEAEEWFLGTEENAVRVGFRGAAVRDALQPVWMDLLVRRDLERARTRLAAALERHPLESLSPGDRPYRELAMLEALLERPERARRALAEYERSAGRDQETDPDWHIARALVDLAEGRAREAATRLQAIEGRVCPVCGSSELAWAHEAAGRPDSAIAAYERFVGTRSVKHVEWYWPDLAGAHERLGELYEARGEGEKAVVHYARFVELWEEADAELQPRVRRAQERLEAILAGRG